MCRIRLVKETPLDLTSLHGSASITETCLGLTTTGGISGCKVQTDISLVQDCVLAARNDVATEKALFDKSSRLVEFKEEYLLLHCKCNIPADEDSFISSGSSEPFP